MAANWQRIWGEKYEKVWHKELKGYHFFGVNYEMVDDAATPAEFRRLAKGCDLANPAKPFFVMTHRRPGAPLRKIAVRSGNGVCLFGHNHCSASNWNIVSLYYGRLPCIQIPSCEPRGSGAFIHDEYISSAKLERKTDKSLIGMSRQGYVVSLYDDMMVIERREFGEGGSLGADWVMPFGKTPHPFSKDELKKVIGEPQFREGAKLLVECCQCENVVKSNVTNGQLETGTGNGNNSTMATVKPSATPRLCVRIPLADGNPDSRVYAYEVVVVGDEGAPKLHKAVYAAGCNMGIGHEPNGGMTTLDIPKSELPPGKTLTIAARPLTSLGTAGKPIAATFRA